MNRLSAFFSSSLSFSLSLKRLILSLCLAGTITYASAQSLLDTPLAEMDTEYLVAQIAWERIPRRERTTDDRRFCKILCYLDDGLFPIENDTGEVITFRSTMSALNFMGKNGFELVSAFYALEEGIHWNTKRFFFKRKLTP
ncbi:MAG: hypothetical protein AAF388_22440 [Bacteroidota bacterium]